MGEQIVVNAEPGLASAAKLQAGQDDEIQTAHFAVGGIFIYLTCRRGWDWIEASLVGCYLVCYSQLCQNMFTVILKAATFR